MEAMFAKEMVRLKLYDREETMIGTLGIEIVEAKDDKVVATMPVHAATRQPFGLLHGGASVALAETVASIGSWQQIDQEKQMAFGLEINANHIQSKSEGIVTAIASPLHKGRTTMVWQIDIVDEENQYISVCRCTVAIRNKKKS